MQVIVHRGLNALYLLDINRNMNLIVEVVINFHANVHQNNLGIQIPGRNPCNGIKRLKSHSLRDAFIFFISDMDEDCYPYVMTMSTSIAPSSRHNSNISSHRLHQQHISSLSQQKQQQQPQPQHIHTSAQSVCSNSSTNDNSSVSSSDIDVDDSNVKDEPLSPSSSCPPSPSSSSASYGGGNVSLANVAAYTNTDLVFEHKVSKFMSYKKYLKFK